MCWLVVQNVLSTSGGPGRPSLSRTRSGSVHTGTLRHGCQSLLLPLVAHFLPLTKSAAAEEARALAVFNCCRTTTVVHGPSNGSVPTLWDTTSYLQPDN